MARKLIDRGSASSDSDWTAVFVRVPPVVRIGRTLGGAWNSPACKSKSPFSPCARVDVWVPQVGFNSSSAVASMQGSLNRKRNAVVIDIQPFVEARASTGASRLDPPLRLASPSAS